MNCAVVALAVEGRKRCVTMVVVIMMTLTMTGKTMMTIMQDSDMSCLRVLLLCWLLPLLLLQDSSKLLLELSNRLV